MIPMDLEVVISYLIHFRYPQGEDYDKDGHMYYVHKISITSINHYLYNKVLPFGLWLFG